jgi:hypothetical protein
VNNADIAWTICFVLWLICFILEKKLKDDVVMAASLLSMEIAFLGFGWIFIGLSHNWW